MRIALPEPDDGIGARDPFLITDMDIDRDVLEGVAPFHDGAVVVWMRQRDGCQTALRLDLVNRGLVYKTDAIPQHITCISANEVGALADSKARLGDDARQAGHQRRKGIMVLPLQFFQRGPALTIRADILALVLANHAACGWLIARRILDTTRRTQ